MEKKEGTPGIWLRVISSNALFDSTATERAPRLIENYLYYKPDLIGLQEINPALQKALVEPMEQYGYKRVSAWPDENRRRESELNSLSKKYPTVNFFPILYRTDRFEEVESEFYMYRSTWTHTKGVTAAVLRERASGRLVAHINTHAAVMLSIYEIENKTPQMAEDWRIDNCREILETKAAIKAKYGDIPVFITGDFNSNESSESYSHYIAAGLENAKYAASLSSSRNIGSFHPVGEMPPQGNDKAPIDHIFVTPQNVKVLTHSIETRKEVLEASDHCIVFADVEI